MIFDANDPRLTAYALGESDPAERSEIEQLLADREDARNYVAEIRQTAQWLAAELQKEPETVSTLAMANHRLIDQALKSAVPTANSRPWWRRPYRLMSMAATLLMGGTVGLFSWSAYQTRENEPRLERPEPGGQSAPADVGLMQKVVAEAANGQRRQAALAQEAAQMAGSGGQMAGSVNHSPAATRGAQLSLGNPRSGFAAGMMSESRDMMGGLAARGQSPAGASRAMAAKKPNAQAYFRGGSVEQQNSLGKKVDLDARAQNQMVANAAQNTTAPAMIRNSYAPASGPYAKLNSSNQMQRGDTRSAPNGNGQQFQVARNTTAPGMPPTGALASPPAPRAAAALLRPPYRHSTRTFRTSRLSRPLRPLRPPQQQTARTARLSRYSRPFRHLLPAARLMRSCSKSLPATPRSSTGFRRIPSCGPSRSRSRRSRSTSIRPVMPTSGDTCCK